MATIKMEGMDRYIRQLENVANATTGICKAAVYAGAGVVVKEIAKGIEGLRANYDVYSMVAYNRGAPTYINIKQKKGLRDSLGIAKIQEKYGVVSTKIGFDGYNDIKTDRWPEGQPNAMIARACESGSSAMVKQPFVRPAVDRSEQQALSAMEEAADKVIKKTIGGEQ